MSALKGRRAMLRGGVVAAVVAASMFAAVSSASAYSWSVTMTAAAQCASHLPCDSGASGSANIYTKAGQPNWLCGQFFWSGVHGAVGFGHIHQAQAGQPENVAYTVNLFGPPTSLSGFQSGVTGCTVVPAEQQAVMARFPQEFMVTIHTTSYPGGAIRGQLGGGNLICELNLCPGPYPG
jgi:hypothetical protein